VEEREVVVGVIEGVELIFILDSTVDAPPRQACCGPGLMGMMIL
jgi:hypothetical protein